MRDRHLSFIKKQFDLSSTSFDFRKILIWATVVFGCYSVFVFAIMTEFPSTVRQTLGHSIVSYCSLDALLRAAFATFLGRVATVMLYDPVFGMFRVIFMYIPFAISRKLPKRLGFPIRRFVINTRRISDAFLFLWITKPVDVSIVLAIAFFFWTLTGEFGQVFVFAVIFTMVAVGGFRAEKMIAGEKGRLGFLFAKIEMDFGELKSLALSSTLLVCAYLAGTSEARALKDNAQITPAYANSGKLVFLSEDMALYLDELDDRELWFIDFKDGHSFEFEEKK